MTLETTARRPEFSNRESADRQAGRFAVDAIRRSPEKAQDPKMIDLLDSVTNGAFWRALAILDGPADGALQGDFLHTYTESDYEERRKHARDWTSQNFKGNDLNKLFEIIQEQAVNPQTFYGAPGDIRGHSTLLAHVVDKEGSIFADKILPEDKKRFVNGAFWEELGYGRTLSSLERVLEEHASELDPELVDEGIKLYERNRAMGGHEANINRFSTPALDSYLDFVKRINDQKVELAIPDEIVDLLLKPYVKAVISPDFDDAAALRFGPKYDPVTEQEIIPVDSYIVRLQDPLVTEFLARSEESREFFADQLPDSSDLMLNIVEAIEGDAGEDILRRYFEGYTESYRKSIAEDLSQRDTDFSRRVLRTLFAENE